MMWKKLILLNIFLILTLSAFTQTYLISSEGVVNTCAGDFFDSGDYSGSYGNSESFIMTFHSTNPVNTHIKMSFNTFDVDPGDTLIVYDGSTISDPVIGKYNNANLPPAFIQATIYNATGDLTFKFISDASVAADGWFCSVVCNPQCQNILAAVDTNEFYPLPDDSNYVDICIGDIIHFAALGVGPGVFPQDGILYDQDSSTTTFIWDFGDGTIDTGRVVNHTYSVVRGYDVNLIVIDNEGCYNTNYIGLRVRISNNPFAEVHPIDDICSGTDTTYVTLGYNSSSIITIDPINSTQSASQRFDSTMFIPDGPNCSVQCYNTFVTFNAFPPGSSISSASDIISICVNMEHSFAGDLGFIIHCPNGQSVVLDPNTHSGGAYMGVPYGGDSHDMYDNGCLAANNPNGTGWTYCWSEVYPSVGTMDYLSSSVYQIDSTDRINNSNYITPENSLNGLIGCPLNGTWNIEICDDYAIDNGYIFWWELNLDPNLLPTSWTYSVPIDTVIWSGSFFDLINDTTIMITPDSAGTFQYTVTVIDIFGCSYDTTLLLQVVETPEIDLGNDTVICNTTYTFSLEPADYYHWSTGAGTSSIVIDTSGIYSVDVENYNLSHSLTCFDSDTVFVKVLHLPNADLGPDICVNEPIDLDAANPGFHYQWNTGDTSSIITATSTDTYSVTVFEELGYNCESTDNIEVKIIPVPEPTLGPDQTICRHNEISVFPTDPDNYLNEYQYDYFWFPYMYTDKIISLSWQPPQVYEIVLQLTGCPYDVVYDTLLLTVNPCPIEVPNIFTPNFDGYNEKFEISNIEYYPNSTMIIYNRWGRKVYENSNYGPSTYWDGDKSADGVYYWILKLNYGDHGTGEQSTEMHGTVTILR